MIGLLLLGFLFLALVGCAISGQLCRVADAVEAQNKHYGIGRPRPTIVNRDEAA